MSKKIKIKVSLPIRMQTASATSLGSKPTCAGTGNASRALWEGHSCLEPVNLVRQTSQHSSDTGRLHCTPSLTLNPGKSVAKNPPKLLSSSLNFEIGPEEKKLLNLIKDLNYRSRFIKLRL